MECYKMNHVSYQYDGIISFEKELTIKRHNHVINIYDPYIQKEILHKKITDKYMKLINKLLLYLNSDDDTGVAYSEVLNEINHFLSLLRGKYRVYLLNKEMEIMEEQLKLIAQNARQKLMHVNMMRRNSFMNYEEHNRKGR